MPILKLIGSEPIQITETQANNIAQMRWGRNGQRPTAEPTDSVELPNVGVFQVKDVRAILSDQKENVPQYVERNHNQLMRCLKRREEVSKWSPLKKAERMLKTYCYLVYRAKGNKGKAKDVMFKDPIYSKLMKPLVEFFEKNPKAHYAPREIYEEYIETKTLHIKNVDGWKQLLN